jgi:hypothetical protein
MTADFQPAENFDGDVYWYRRLRNHSRPLFEAAAKDFRDAVAKDLGLLEPYPEIVWYAPMDYVEAETKWEAATREHPNASWAVDDNPFITPVDVFRFDKRESEAVVHGGYTHKDGPRLIGIMTEQPAEQIFECIAHECVHVHQDDREGPGWRMNNIGEADAEAWDYQSHVKSRFPDHFENIPAIA